jgi:hypothetical protein
MHSRQKRSPTHAGPILQISTGKQPFHGVKEFGVLQLVSEGKRPSRPTEDDCLGPYVDDAFWELITMCWKRDPEKRPSMQQVLDYFVSGASPTSAASQTHLGT